MDEAAVFRSMARITHEIIEKNTGQKLEIKNGVTIELRPINN